MSDDGGKCLPMIRIDVVVAIELDEQCMLANIRGHSLQLKGLESGPAKQCGVHRSEFSKMLRQIFVRVSRANWLLLSTGKLSGGVLTDRFV
jgi:hypothetical protein